METLFDFATVACFLGLVGAYFLLTARRRRTLLHFLVSGIAFAVANQLGNADYVISGVILIIAGIGYAVIVVRNRKARLRLRSQSVPSKPHQEPQTSVARCLVLALSVISLGRKIRSLLE